MLIDPNLMTQNKQGPTVWERWAKFGPSDPGDITCFGGALVLNLNSTYCELTTQRS